VVQRERRFLCGYDLELDRPHAALARLLADAREQRARNPPAASLGYHVELFDPQDRAAALDGSDLVGEEDRCRPALALGQPEPRGRMRRERKVIPRATRCESAGK